ncbi:MAG: menaquinone biosynthesis protein [Thermoanaerobaculia bacterium]
MRYALIRFLNARPLWWGLTHRPGQDDQLRFTSPALCADLVADGAVDLGLIPAIELARIPDVVAVPSICIGSRTEVRSVLLVSRVPFEEIRSVALDPSSRTSVALTRILLAEKLGEETYRTIRFDPSERGRLLALEGHDAAVVIGDPALQISRDPGPSIRFRYDLVSEWNALFGDPFVFALWAGRRDSLERFLAEEVHERLLASRAFGISQEEVIAREASEELALPYEELLDYFRSALHYEFGEDERRALARFYDLAAKYALIEGRKEIEWLFDPKKSQTS